MKKKERGVALLAVLLGVAMMTLIVVEFAMTSGLGFVSAANQANELRATYLARSGINVGLALLAASTRAQQADLQAAGASGTTAQGAVDTLNDPWATPFPPMPLEGGTVALSIVDEDRKLNINSLVTNGQPSQPAIQKMQRLFTVLDVDVNLVQGIVDWITPNSGTGGMGADYYLQLKPPYQPRFGPMPTIGDLQMVKGFNEAVFNRVSPFLSVINATGPTSFQVNVNTAPPQVLAALEPELMEDQKLVMAIIDRRAEEPFSSTTDVTNLLNLTDQNLSKDIVVKSGYFTIRGMGTYAGARKIITATFQRQQNGIGVLNAWRED